MELFLVTEYMHSIKRRQNSKVIIQVEIIKGNSKGAFLLQIYIEINT